jgi:mRNA interferase MazF
MNIGVEVYGKGPKFERPVLILKKFTAEFFFGIPITTQIKKGPWYTSIRFGGKELSAMLSHARALDVVRLTERMGTLPENQFQKIREAFLELYGETAEIDPKNDNPAEKAGNHSSPAAEPENSG